MKQYRKHLSLVGKTTLTESATSQAAARTVKALEEFERAARNLAAAWEDAIDTIGDDSIQFPDRYPFGDSFDEVATDITTFVKDFTRHLKQVK